MAKMRPNHYECPTCGHAVSVVGSTTQHYEPIGCLQLVDDHEVCDSEVERLRAALSRIKNLNAYDSSARARDIAAETLDSSWR